jgi:hypothetical protein
MQVVDMTTRNMRWRVSRDCMPFFLQGSIDAETTWTRQLSAIHARPVTGG